jgi:hypothetical protein
MPQLRLSNAIAAAVAAEIEVIRTEGLLDAFPPAATAIIKSEKLPIYELKDLNVLRINASPTSRSSSRGPGSRNTTEQEHVVTVQLTMRTLNNSELFDQLIDFVSDLDDLLAARYLDVAGREISWESSDINPIYDIDEAYTNKVFLSQIQVNWQAFDN